MRFKLFFIIFLSVLPSLTANDIIVYQGLSLAYPGEMPALEYASTLNYYAEDRIFEVVLKVGKKGRVKAVKAFNEAEGKNIKVYEKYLKTMVFVPGTFKGKKQNQYIPVKLNVPVNRRIPELTFPLNNQAEIQNRLLYDKALTLNGIEPPRIDFFPSYNYHFENRNDEPRYPFVLFKLNLDDEGRPTVVELVRSTCDNFTDQHQSAVHWGRYSPLYVKGKARVSENFLLISLLPQVNYPTTPFNYSEKDSCSLRERERVRLLPDTLGLLSGPYPRNIIGQEFVCPDNAVKIVGEATYRIAVDTLGNVKMLRSLRNNKRLKRGGMVLVSYLKFFPAIDNQGRPRPFDDFIRVTYSGSKKVKIDFLWLPA